MEHIKIYRNMKLFHNIKEGDEHITGGRGTAYLKTIY